MAPYRVPGTTCVASPMLVYRAELETALLHSLSSKRSRRRLAAACAFVAMCAAIKMGRPDLTSNANDVLAIVSRGAL